MPQLSLKSSFAWTIVSPWSPATGGKKYGGDEGTFKDAVGLCTLNQVDP
jgi:hypothetical protein